MLPKNKRIPRKLFGSILNSKKYLNSKNFSLKTAPSGKCRVAVTVSKKVSKKASLRNRVRRRAYAAINTIIPTLPNKLFLLIAKPEAKNIKGTNLKKELSALFKKG